MAFSLDDQAKSALARFLERRNLKERMIALFGTAIERHDLTRGELTQAKNATYAKIVDSIETAIQNHWLTKKDVIDVLDDSEIAGRQHVCLFNVSSNSITSVLSDLADPGRQTSSPRSLSSFYEVPSSSSARVLRNTNSEVLVKIAARRQYWVSELDQSQSGPQEEWIHRWIEEERAAVVLKCTKTLKLLQLRVPPRERLMTAETGKTVYQFLREVLDDHYDLGKGSWFEKLSLFPIGDGYNSILKNRTDFVLRHDTPESPTAKSRLSKKGAVKNLDDLRDDKMWVFADGYARKTLRGTWLINGKPVYTHLNMDRVRTGPTSSIEFARVFFPRLATDAEVDDVLTRISEHL